MHNVRLLGERIKSLALRSHPKLAEQRLLCHLLPESFLCHRLPLRCLEARRQGFLTLLLRPQELGVQVRPGPVGARGRLGVSWACQSGLGPV